MKMHCKECGCHFDDDFEETLSDECNMWVGRGFSKDMSVEHKRALFDAFFSLPVDEIADETGVVATIELRGSQSVTYAFNQFEEYVPGYKDLVDKERRDFQKRYFKFYYNQSPKDQMLMYLGVMGELGKTQPTTKKCPDCGGTGDPAQPLVENHCQRCGGAGSLDA